MVLGGGVTLGVTVATIAAAARWTLAASDSARAHLQLAVPMVPRMVALAGPDDMPTGSLGPARNIQSAAYGLNAPRLEFDQALSVVAKSEALPKDASRPPLETALLNEPAVPQTRAADPMRIPVRTVSFKAPPPKQATPTREATPAPVTRPKLAYASPTLDLMPPPVARIPDPANARTAVYDITARAVYLPNGQKLEAHSGLGDMMDDPRYINKRMRGATPPNIYQLTLRQPLFHGVQAIRLNPIDEGKMFGRDGILAHTYMLGPNGQSNGCVSFRDYPKFLRAFLKGEIDRIVVVSRDGTERFAQLHGRHIEKVADSR